jgi:hypothetical protein
VEVDFDPSQVSYEQLVEKFFGFHDATRPAPKRQYMSAILVRDAEQERTARSVMQRVQETSERAIQTSIIPLAEFYLAEDYHQKYALQRITALFGEFQAMYPNIWDLVDSTAATRVNAYLYGIGTAEQLSADLDGLGLSEKGKARLQSASPVGACPVN